MRCRVYMHNRVGIDGPVKYLLLFFVHVDVINRSEASSLLTILRGFDNKSKHIEMIENN